MLTLEQWCQMNLARSSLLVGALMCFLPAVGSTQEPGFVAPTEAQYQLFKEGQDAYVAGEYLRSVDLFKASLLVGDLNITYLNLGRAHFKLGRCAEARGAFAKVRKAPRVKEPKPESVLIRLNEYLVELDEKCVEGAGASDAEAETKCPEGTVFKEGRGCVGAVVCPEGTRLVEDKCVAKVDLKCPEGTIFKMGSGCVASVALDLGAAASEEERQTVAGAPSKKGGSVLAWTMLGLGGLGLVGSGIFVTFQLSNNAAIDELERTRLRSGEAAQLNDLVEEGQLLEVGIWTSLGVGAVLSTLGVIWLMDDSEEESASGWSIQPIFNRQLTGITVEVSR